MNTTEILKIVAKGISVAEAIWDNRDLALGAIQSVKHIVENKSTVTQTEIDEVETSLDAMLNEFNSDLPSEA